MVAYTIAESDCNIWKSNLIKMLHMPLLTKVASVFYTATGLEHVVIQKSSMIKRIENIFNPLDTQEERREIYWTQVGMFLLLFHIC